ncbi:MAG: ribosome small subunit-dependent GTPase A [Clostridiales bacterium]|nr:ribosome small subunit-dependent GTPase A [Clostridiales bacterium]
MTGTVVKGIGGFYFVYDGNEVVMGKARGNLKRNKELIYVGDVVDFDIDENDKDGECVIHRVIERKNHLTRPPVSNLDILVVVFSLVSPDVNYPVIDKLIAGCELAGISPVICISKTDLVMEEAANEALAIYSASYPAVKVNGVTGDGSDGLRRIIKGRNVALAGPSGVGKSTITNLLHAGETDIEEAEEKLLKAATGRVSSKTGRGRHTTRHVEIFPLSDGTMLYDTPGFTSLDMPVMEPVAVRELFPEFREPAKECRYSDCMHINEPDCAVKEALQLGQISRSRYDSYLTMTEEVKKWQR